MKIKIPFERYTLTSKLTPDEIKIRLQKQLVEFHLTNGEITIPYNGFIDDDSFEMSRIYKSTKQKNVSDGIKLKGTIKATKTGSIIKIKIGIGILSYLLLFSMIGVCATELTLTGGFSQIDKLDVILLFWLAVITLSFFLQVKDFSKDVFIPKQFLHNLVEANHSTSVPIS